MGEACAESIQHHLGILVSELCSSLAKHRDFGLSLVVVESVGEDDAEACSTWQHGTQFFDLTCAPLVVVIPFGTHARF